MVCVFGAAHWNWNEFFSIFAELMITIGMRCIFLSAIAKEYLDRYVIFTGAEVVRP